MAQVIFFVPFLSITTDGQDATTDVYGIGKVMFIGIIGVVSWEIALISRFWTWIFILVWALSYAVTFPFLWALGALFQGLKVYDSSQVRPSAFTSSRCQCNCSALAYICKTSKQSALNAPLSLLCTLNYAAIGGTIHHHSWLGCLARSTCPCSRDACMQCALLCFGLTPAGSVCRSVWRSRRSRSPTSGWSSS